VKLRRLTTKLLLALAVLLAGWPAAASACAVCYGDPESPMSRGLTWGILALVMVVGTVLTGAVAFFVQAGRRSERLNPPQDGEKI
jgi:hypothetical protein